MWVCEVKPFKSVSICIDLYDLFFLMDLKYQPSTTILTLSSYCYFLIDRWHKGLAFCKTLLVHQNVLSQRGA
jgi:hypothetical protein